MADLVVEAGFPPGVFNIVQGIGEEIGAALVAHPLLRRVSFTGSPETGRLIGTAAAGNLVPFTAELGGKGPLIVFADADLDAAAKKAAGQYDDSGQVCLAGTRLLVEESVRDEFVERFDAYVDEHVLGDPREQATTMSPLIHPDHLARVEGFVERARKAGDMIVRGGARAGGLHYEPTLVEPASNDSEIVQREVFGPVLTLQSFAGEDEAVALANSTEYGLSGIVYTSSLGRADRVGRALRAGTVWVNTFLVRDLTAPFGGDGHLRDRARGRQLRARLLLGAEDVADPRRNRALVPHVKEEGRVHVHRPETASAADRFGGSGSAPARARRADLVFFIVAASAPLTAVAGGRQRPTW